MADLDFLPDKPKKRRDEALAFLPDQPEGEDISFLPDQGAAAQPEDRRPRFADAATARDGIKDLPEGTEILIGGTTSAYVHKNPRTGLPVVSLKPGTTDAGLAGGEEHIFDLADPVKDEVQRLQRQLTGMPTDNRGVVLPGDRKEPTAAEKAAALVRETIRKAVPDMPTTSQDALETALAPILAPSAPIRSERGRELAGSAGAGAAGALGSMAAFEPAVEAFIGIKTPVGEISQDVAAKLQAVAKDLQPDTPDFADKLASGAGSMAAFLFPAAAGARAVSLVPRMGALAGRLAPAIETGVSTVLESATEAGGVYQKLTGQGIKPEVAAQAAFKDFMGNMLLVGVTNRFGIFGEKGTELAKALKAASLEAIQEAGQSLIASAAAGEDPDWNEVVESAGIGAIVGGGAKGIMTTVSRETLGEQGADYLVKELPVLAQEVDGQSYPMDPETLKETITKAAAAAKEAELRGAAPEEAQLAAVQVFQEEIAKAAPPEEAPQAQEPTAEDFVEQPREALRRDLAEKFRLPEEQAEAVFSIADARAQAWSRQTGRPAREWFETRIAGVKAGGAVSEAALRQGPADAFETQGEFPLPEQVDVLQLEQVPDAAARPFSAKRSEAVRLAKEIYQGKTFKNRQTGLDIGVTLRGINRASFSGSGDEHLAALRSLDKIIEGSVYLRSEADRKGRPDVKRWMYFYAPVGMEGKDYLLRLAVRETKDGQRYYDHAVVETERPAGNLTGGASADEALRLRSDGRSQLSLSDLIGLVKRQRQQDSFFQDEKDPKGAVEFLQDNRAIITAFGQADVSTAIHELSHIFRRDLSAEDLSETERWTGVVEGAWTTAAEEKFARGFERYLTDGKAPTPALQGVFEQFRAWLLNIYQAITGSAIDVEISPEMRSVFDRLLAGETQAGGGGTTQPPAPPAGTIPRPEGPSPLGPRREPKIYTERQALRQSLKRQAQAAAEADRIAREESAYERRFLEAEHKAMLQWQDAKLRAQGARKVQEAKAQVTEKERARAARVAEIKKEIRGLVEKGLPLHERGRYLAAVASAKTPLDVAKAAVRVDAHVEKLIRKDLVGEIKKRAGAAMDSAKVDAFYKDKIKAVLDDIQFSRPKQETVDKLKAIERKIQADRLVRGALDPQQKMGLPEDYLPRRYLDALKVLHRKSVDELTMNELQNVNDKVQLLENLGRQRSISEAAFYQREKAERISQLLSGTKAIARRRLIDRMPGERPRLTARAVNFIRGAMNKAQHVDLVLSPMDVVFDVLDGVKNYEGPNSRIIKQTLDTDYGNYLDDSRAMTLPVQQLAQELKMDESNFERIAVHAYRVQPGGRDYLQNGGLTDEQIDAVKLTPSEERVYEKMRAAIERPYPQVSEVMRQLYNVKLGKIENYFPVQIDHDAVSDIELFQRIGDLMTADAIGRRTKTVEQGFTKQRVGTNKKVKLNSMDVFTRHMDDAAYLINMQRDIKMLSEIANSPEYVQAAGDEGAYLVSQWLDTMARKGGGEGMKRVVVLDMLRRNFGVAQLGFKLSSAVIQPTALMDGAALVGGKYVVQGLERLADKQWRQFLSDNFPELRARIADDPAFMELENGSWLLRRAREAAYKPLKGLDLITASAVTAGAYQKALDDLGRPLDMGQADPEAVKIATRLLRRTQASSSFKDAPLAISRGQLTGNRSFDKALLQFKSFMLNRWSLIRHDFYRAGIKEGDSAKAAQIATYLTLATITEAGIRHGLRDLFGEGDDKKDKDSFAAEALKQALGNVPFLGDLMSMSIYGSEPIPAFSSGEDLGEGLKGIIEFKKPKSKARAAVKIGKAVGSLLGVPGTAQAAQLLNALLRDKKGKPRPADVMSSKAVIR